MARVSRQGQSTVEFALMLPMIFALLFVGVEYAWYLGGLHYVNYATFMAARAVQANDDINAVGQHLLTGVMTEYNGSGGGVTFTEAVDGVQANFTWESSLPGIRGFIGDMSTQVIVSNGPAECSYELRTSTADKTSDNRLECQ